jgi:hypothetical protein
MAKPTISQTISPQPIVDSKPLLPKRPNSPVVFGGNEGHVIGGIDIGPTRHDEDYDYRYLQGEDYSIHARGF